MGRGSLACIVFGLPLAAFSCSSSSSGIPDNPNAPPEGGAFDSPSGVDSSPGDAGSVTDAGTDSSPEGGGGGGLSFACAATKSPATPNACPAPSGAAGQVSFCYRPQWAGVTSVDVYGGFTGTASDWKTSFLSLKDDGSGTFTGTTSLANGTYPYMFRTGGSADNLVTTTHYFLDQYNPAFVPPPAGAPLQRTVSSVTVPQPAPAPVAHVKGTVLFNGQPQSCYSVDIEAGELVSGGKVISEHTTANYMESGADGAFDFPVASTGPYGIIVRFPFLLSGADAGYPVASMTPSVGYARTNVTLTGADGVLDPLDIAYPAADYAALSPTGGTATLPVTFTFTVVPGAAAASVAVIGTDIPGNDPAYWSSYGTTTSLQWNGMLGGTQGTVKLGTTYYWGTWQRRDSAVDGGTTWAEESLLFPITFH
jgi:hypothetical protein